MKNENGNRKKVDEIRKNGTNEMKREGVENYTLNLFNNLVHKMNLCYTRETKKKEKEEMENWLDCINNVWKWSYSHSLLLLMNKDKKFRE